jgi:hypothetical protein
MKKIAFWMLLTLCVSGSWVPASAAIIFGSGEVQPGTPSTIDYESPSYLLVGRIEQLTGSQIAGGHMTMAYYGEAQYGRLGVQTFAGGHHLAMPELSVAAYLALGFEDTITPDNFQPGSHLLLDIGLTGFMSRIDTTYGPYANITSAEFMIGTRDPSNPDNFQMLLDIMFIWFGDQKIIALSSDYGPFAPLFVTYPDGDPNFTQSTNPLHPGFSFGASGYIDIALGGSPFDLFVRASASSSCAQQSTQCAADTHFGNTALIGNARIVDANGDTVPGASFASQSGYDYLIPPGPLAPGAVPEPVSIVLAGLGLAAIAVRRKFARN